MNITSSFKKHVVTYVPIAYITSIKHLYIIRHRYVQGADMPRKGFKTITVSEEKHQEAKDKAAKKGLGLQEYVEKLIDQNPTIVLTEVPPIE